MRIAYRLCAALAIAGCSTMPAGGDGSDLAVTAPTDGGVNSAADQGMGGGNDAGCPPFPDAERAKRIDWLRSTLQTSVTKFETKNSDGQGGITCPAPGSSTEAVHDFGDYAFARVTLAPNDPATQKLAESALTCVLSFETDTGGFPFHVGDAPSVSDNSGEFAMASLALYLHSGMASAPFAAAAVPKVRAALGAIDGHAVCPGYTNICFYQIAELVTLGTWLAANPDPMVAADGTARVTSGRSRLEAAAPKGWLGFTRAAGLTEFDSPTYNEVDLEALHIALVGAPDDQYKAEVRAALDYIWANVASVNFRPRGTIAGPYSRTYDFFYGQANVCRSLYYEGLRDTQPSSPGLDAAVLLYADSLYRPPAATLCFGDLPSRDVLGTWGPDGGAGGKQRYTYLTPDVTLGTTSADYTTNPTSVQDEMIQAELANGDTGAVITPLGDYLDDPGSSIQAGDFSKVTHVPIGAAAAQLHGTALVTLVLPARDPGYMVKVAGVDTPVPLVKLSTDISLPIDGGAVLLIDGAPQMPPNAPVKLGSNPVVTVKIGSSVAAVAVLDASGRECPSNGAIADATQPEIDLQQLPTPSPHMIRLTVYHDLNPKAVSAQTLATCFARLALLLAVGRCDGAGCDTAFATQVAGLAKAAKASFTPATGDWDLSAATLDQHTLHVHRVAGPNAKVLAREVDGAALVFPPLSLNGVPISLGP
jgi:hypothetical protein